MNKINVLCVLVVCCVATSQAGRIIFPDEDNDRPSRYCSDHRGRRVGPGQSYYDGCNWCTCGRNGQSACTRRWCPELNSNVQRYCTDHQGNRIAPGQSYYDGCNWCTCGRNGESACTRMWCPDD